MTNYDFEKPKRGDAYVYDTEELAGIGDRLIAQIIDAIILGLIGGLLFSQFEDGPISGIITFVIGLIYNWYFLTQQHGQTLGKPAWSKSPMRRLRVQTYSCVMSATISTRSCLASAGFGRCLIVASRAGTISWHQHWSSKRKLSGSPCARPMFFSWAGVFVV